MDLTTNTTTYRKKSTYQPNTLYINVGKENRREVRFTSNFEELNNNSRPMSRKQSLVFEPMEEQLVICEGEEEERNECVGCSITRCFKR